MAEYNWYKNWGSQKGLVDDYLGRDKREADSSAPCNITNL